MLSNTRTKLVVRGAMLKGPAGDLVDRKLAVQLEALSIWFLDHNHSEVAWALRTLCWSCFRQYTAMRKIEKVHQTQEEVS